MAVLKTLLKLIYARADTFLLIFLLATFSHIRLKEKNHAITIAFKSFLSDKLFNLY